MTRWDAWALVVGERLPTDWLTIPTLEIHPADEEEVTSLRGLRMDVSVEFDPGHPNHFDVSRAPVRVESKWILRFEFDAEDRDDAVARVRAEAGLRSSLLDSLAPEASKPFHLEILSVVNPRTGEGVPMPLEWNVYPVNVAEMTSDDLLVLQRRASVLLGSEDQKSAQAVRSAASLLRDATYLADTSMGMQLLHNASLLLYFQIIEGISQFVGRSRSGRVDEAADADREEIVNGLAERLSRTGSPGEASRLIHRADFELRQAEATHLKRRVQTAGEVLGLEAPVIEDAWSFLDVRSAHLAHFGASLPRDVWVRWFHQRNARRVATHYFAAFLDWLGQADGP
jgi:hypothetical protein